MRGMRYCRLCSRELIGSIENVFVDIGSYTHLVSRDSRDCNWRRCKGCADVLCKSCYAGQRKYCCDEDRIVNREKVQVIAECHWAIRRQLFRSPDSLTGYGGANQNNQNNKEEEDMSDFKIVYLIVERGAESHRQVFWRSAGTAFLCRDGSMNVKLDIHPGLTFNIRDPKSNGEREEAFPNISEGNGALKMPKHGEPQPEVAAGKIQPQPASSEAIPHPVGDDDIPF